jgi:hypothetical protein
MLLQLFMNGEGEILAPYHVTQYIKKWDVFTGPRI